MIKQIEEFIKQIQDSRRYSFLTKKAYTKTITNFSTYLEENQVKTLNLQKIEGFFTYLEHEAIERKEIGDKSIGIGREMDSLTMKNSSMNRHLPILRKLLHYLGYNEVARELKSYKVDSRFDIIEYSEIKKIFDINKLTEYFEEKSPESKNQDFYVMRMKLLIDFVVSVGSRLTETSNLKKSQLKLERKIPLVEFVGKGNKTRVVELSIKWLKEYQEFISKYQKVKDSEYIFTSFGGGKLSFNTLNSYIKDLAHFIGVPKLSMHKLRHCYAILSYEQNGDIVALSKRLGHNDIKTTMIYLSHVLSEKKAQVSPLDVI